MHTVSTSNVFANNSWVNLVVTYSNSSGMLTVYTNATVSDPSSLLIHDGQSTSAVACLSIYHAYTDQRIG